MRTRRILINKLTTTPYRVVPIFFPVRFNSRLRVPTTKEAGVADSTCERGQSSYPKYKVPLIFLPKPQSTITARLDVHGWTAIPVPYWAIVDEDRVRLKEIQSGNVKQSFDANIGCVAGGPVVRAHRYNTEGTRRRHPHRLISQHGLCNAHHKRPSNCSNISLQQTPFAKQSQLPENQSTTTGKNRTDGHILICDASSSHGTTAIMVTPRVTQ